MNRAVFVERDGILNRVAFGNGNGNGASPVSLEHFHVIPEARDMVRHLKSAGFHVIVTTNQPGLSRGTLSRRELDAMHDLLRNALPLDDILVCPHEADDECPCRKPKPGLLIEAAFKWHLDMSQSYVVSDKWQDAAAAHAVNCTSVLLRSSCNGQCHHDVIRDTLEGIAAEIVGERSRRRHLVGVG